MHIKPTHKENRISSQVKKHMEMFAFSHNYDLLIKFNNVCITVCAKQ